MQDMMNEVSRQLIDKEFIEEQIIVPKHKPTDPHIDLKAPLIYSPGLSPTTEMTLMVADLKGEHILKVDRFSKYQVIIFHFLLLFPIFFIFFYCSLEYYT